MCLQFCANFPCKCIFWSNHIALWPVLYLTCTVFLLQYDHLELSKSKCFLYSNQPTKVDSNTCPDFVYIYHLCFRSNLASYQSFQSPREGGVIKSEKSTLQSNQLNFGTENRKRLLRCLSQLIWIVDSLPSLLKGVLKGKKFK